MPLVTPAQNLYIISQYYMLPNVRPGNVDATLSIEQLNLQRPLTQRYYPSRLLRRQYHNQLVFLELELKEARKPGGKNLRVVALLEHRENFGRDVKDALRYRMKVK